MSSGDHWSGRCTLIAETEPMDERNRPQTVLKDVKTVYCKEVGIKQNEFYQAAQQGYKVEAQIEIRKASYAENITHLRYKGKVYRILRTYQPKSAENIGLVVINHAGA